MSLMSILSVGFILFLVNEFAFNFLDPIMPFCLFWAVLVFLYEATGLGRE